MRVNITELQGLLSEDEVQRLTARAEAIMSSDDPELDQQTGDMLQRFVNAAAGRDDDPFGDGPMVDASEAQG